MNRALARRRLLLRSFGKPVFILRFTNALFGKPLLFHKNRSLRKTNVFTVFPILTQFVGGGGG